MMSKNTVYKRENIKTWNEIAPRYHRRWVNLNNGPWKSSDKLVRLSEIKKNDTVLDVACGTGVVTEKISNKIGDDGFVTGIDTSTAAIKIAKRLNRKRTNVDFVNGDAEKFSFAEKFDVITCQYALFFFPNSQRALKNMALNLKKNGILGISVHGNHTPYYTAIDVTSRYIPDCMPAGSAKLDRFGTIPALKKEIAKAGFRKISTREFNFSYSPGTFDEYWRNYRRYVARPIREKLGRLSRSEQLKIRRQVKEKTVQYTRKNGQIVFPWQVLISTARV